MRQSVEAKTRGPILWYGDYADFGSFSGALSSGAREPTINFSLTADVHFSPAPNLTLSEFENYYVREERKGTIPQEVDIDLELIESENETKTHQLKITIGTEEIAFKRADKYWNFYINNKRITNKNFILDDAVNGGLIPKIIPVKDTESSSIRSKWKFVRSSERRNYFDDNEIKSSMVFRAFKRYFHGVSNDQKIITLLRGACVFDRKRLLSFLKNRFDDQSIFMDNLEKHKENLLAKAAEVVLLINAKKILSQSNQELVKSLSETRYIGPMRASAERYYRFKDLQVSELDPQGGNLVMLISSLSTSDLAKLKSWSLVNFGFEIDVVKLGDHYELKVKPDGSSDFINVSDMGFGFSQVLPIVVAIWDAQRLKPSNDSISAFSSLDLREEGRIFIIEQPELHLHPKMQHVLAVTIAKLAGNKEFNIKFIIETHSKTFIDGIGYALRNSFIYPDDVSVNVIEREEGCADESHRRESTYNEKGQLLNWPAGFFSPW